MKELQRNALKTAKEVQSILQISPATLWRLTKKKRIPSIRVGSNVRYDIDKVMEVLEKSSK